MESPAEAPPPVVPKVVREESDLTTAASVCMLPADTCEGVSPPDHHVSILQRTRMKWYQRLKFRKGSYKLVRQQQIKNSLLAGVGYLELANAGDFAANVWNEIPVPRHAMILMAIGGPIALCMMSFAVRDFALSWRNVRLLRAERVQLLALRASLASSSTTTTATTATAEVEKHGEMVRVLDSRLGVGVRELGTEIVDRMVMDAVLGFGALLVGVGTIMAIFGAHPRVYLASNLLSGYVGNSMAAIFGLVNAVWSGMLVYRFQCHDVAARPENTSTVDDGSYVLSPTQQQRLHVRCRRFQWHSLVNALNGLVAGAASMVTATRWWGYVVLIPCIISLILCNYFWRWKLGYDRPIMTTATSTSVLPQHNIVAFLPPLLTDLSYVSAVHDALDQTESLPRSLVNLNSLDSVISFIAMNHMFESFCEWLLAEDQAVIAVLIDTDPSQHTHIHTQGIHTHTVLTLSPRDFLSGLAHSHQPGLEALLLDRARSFIRMFGKKIFAYRERYLLELVGYAVWRDQHP